MKVLFDETAHTQWFITDSGKIMSRTTYRCPEARLREVKPNINRARGYLYARTSNRNYQVHRLVATAFISNPLNKPCVNHIDGDRHNNHRNNLEWATHQENTAHAIKSGRLKLLGKNEGNTKYTNEECREVLQRVKDGMSYKEAGAIHQMPYSTVAHLIRGSRRAI